MSGQQFLDVAKKLVSMRTEAALRTAIGRGYYAAFNCSVQFLMDLGFSMSQAASDHEKVYYDLKKLWYWRNGGNCQNFVSFTSSSERG